LERPFHALSYPDIDFTVMRPAFLPPSAHTNVTFTPATAWPQPAAPTAPNGFVYTPSWKNPYLFTNNNPVQPPPIPVRRLFQIPDKGPSNADPNGDPAVNRTITDVNSILFNPQFDLSAIPSPPVPPAPAPANPLVINFHYGSNWENVVAPGSSTPSPWSSGADSRRNPFFRTEWLQKVMNLTTVRTHQFAVWITVGFFEVTREGDPQMASTTAPTLAYDQLGMELNLLSGHPIRYRSFFLLDRTRAVGFNPFNPGNFRDVIVYRRSIE